MTDPLDALRTPIVPIDPDPAFARRLRARLVRSLTDPTGGPVTDTTTPATDATSGEDAAWPPALTPYIAVADARRAIDWYVEVFGASRRGDLYVMPDGSIGHAEIGIGDAVLMLSEGSDQVPVRPPEGGGPFSHTLHVQVDDVDAVLERARHGGAAVEREPVDQPYGRVAVMVDPFGHRWMLNRPPARATRLRPGDIAYVTMVVADDERAREFYGRVLGWRFSPGTVERGWNVDDVRPMVGLAGSPDQAAEVQLCFRVADIEAAARRVRDLGGQAEAPARRPYGVLCDCVDNQGTAFQLWEPVD